LKLIVSCASSSLLACELSLLGKSNIWLQKRHDREDRNAEKIQEVYIPADTDPIWDQYATAVVAQGLVAGRNFPKFKDSPHCEMPWEWVSDFANGCSSLTRDRYRRIHMRDVTRRSFLDGISKASVGFLFLTKTGLADVGQAELAARRSRVLAACTKHWPDNQGDCSGFVRAVAQDLGFALSGNANAMYTQISKDPWIRIGIGTQASATAGITAGEGKFVVAAEQGQKNGHVAIVVDYRNAFDSYSQVDRDKAVAFWGKLHSTGAEYERITRSWTATDLERVLFAYQIVS
jgi:hypothetical protein